MKINISYDTFSVQNLAAGRVIRTCIAEALRAEKVPVSCEINVLITNDKGIHQINLASRQIDKPTDVLSFPMFSFEPGKLPQDWSAYIDPESGLCPLGDMCISLERAIAQGKEFGHSTRREVGYLVVHSVLHLLGYDHLDEGPQKAQMRKREEEIISGIPRMSR